MPEQGEGESSPGRASGRHFGGVGWGDCTVTAGKVTVTRGGRGSRERLRAVERGSSAAGIRSGNGVRLSTGVRLVTRIRMAM